MKPKTRSSRVTGTSDHQPREWRLFCAQAQPNSPPEFRLTVPTAWAEDNSPRLAQNLAPVTAELIPGAEPQRQEQYPLLQEAKCGIQEHLAKLKEAGILVEGPSAWNTPRTSQETGRGILSSSRRVGHP